MKHLMQLNLPLNDLEPTKATPIVNVASVVQRSVFRYPGGKTWFVPFFKHWFSGLETQPKRLLEPFGGGGIISLTAVFEGLVERAILVELDDDIAAVWQTILGPDSDTLAERILHFEISTESVDATLALPSQSRLDQAFKTILRNRVNRGGILAPGAGRVKGGENGKGLASRWYPQTLYRRIKAITAIRERLTFIQGDALEVMQSYQPLAGTVAFIDPPYSAAGKKAATRLYHHSHINHQHLFRIAQDFRGPIIMTYDDTEEIRLLSREHGFIVETIAMKNSHHAHMQEIVISRTY
jgi:DNA adenine methylase